MKTIAVTVSTLIVAALVVGSMLATAERAGATPAFSSQTGKGCPTCHTMPPNAGNLNGTGKQFKANGNKF